MPLPTLPPVPLAPSDLGWGPAVPHAHPMGTEQKCVCAQAPGYRLDVGENPRWVCHLPGAGEPLHLGREVSPLQTHFSLFLILQNLFGMMTKNMRKRNMHCFLNRRSRDVANSTLQRDQRPGMSCAHTRAHAG